MTSSSHNAAGIGLMLLAVFLFSSNDALGKWLLGTYSVWQMLLIRSIAALVVLSPFIWRARSAFARDRIPRPGLQILRLIFATGESILFFWAVIYLPLADTMAFYLAGPIYVTALSAMLLGERVGWRRWTAVLVGFLGVLIILRPTSALFSGPAVIALIGSFLYALFMVLTRTLRGTPDIVSVTGQIVAMLVVTAFIAPLSWTTPPPPDFLLLSLLGVVAVTGFTCVVRSLRLAPASVVVPYQYTFLIWAVIYGYLVFGDIPHPATFVGGAIIVAAGLYIYMRERKVGQEEKSYAPPQV